MLKALCSRFYRILLGSLMLASLQASTLMNDPALAQGEEQLVLVANKGSLSISVIASSSNAVIATIKVASGPLDVLANPDASNALYIGTGSYGQINTSEFIALHEVRGSVLQQIAAIPSAPFACMTDSSARKVYCARLPDLLGTTVYEIPVEGSPLGIAFAPDGKKGYVTIVNQDMIAVLDIANRAVSGTIAVGDSPRRVVIAPDGKHGYVTNFNDDTVSVVNLSR